MRVNSPLSQHHLRRDGGVAILDNAERARPFTRAHVDEVLSDDDDFQNRPQRPGEAPEQLVMATQPGAEPDFSAFARAQVLGEPFGAHPGPG